MKDFIQPPKKPWQIVLSLFGFPVMRDGGPIQMPMLTTSLLILCCGTALLSRFDFHVIMTLGFIPEQWSRRGGTTVLTSAIMHSNIWHLLGNMYFLVVFGSRTELRMGRARFVGLLLFALFLETLFFVALAENGNIPSVGASGMIAGILGYFLVHFFRERIGFFLIFRWFWIPVWVFLGGWGLIQILGSLQQMEGTAGGVNYLSHLGGFIAGILLAFMWHPVFDD